MAYFDGCSKKTASRLLAREINLTPGLLFVHRFAIGYHHQRRSSSAFKSSLTDIEGVGKTRAKNLLKHFGSIKNIREAELEELENAPSMTRNAAAAVYAHFHSEDES